MERRSTAKTLFEASLVGGIAAMIGAVALPVGSPYFTTLIVLGSVGIVVGLGGLLWMLNFPVRNDDAAPKVEPTTGIVFDNCEGLEVTQGVEAHGFDHGVRAKDSPNMKFGWLRTTARKKPSEEDKS